MDVNGPNFWNNAKLNFIKALINSSVNIFDYLRCKVKGLVYFQIKFS